MGTLICLNRNSSWPSDAYYVFYMKGNCGMCAADSPVVLSCFAFFKKKKKKDFVVLLYFFLSLNVNMGALHVHFFQVMFLFTFIWSYFHFVHPKYCGPSLFWATDFSFFI